MTTYWAPHALLPTGHASKVRVRVEDGRITAITSRTRPAPGDVMLSGVLLPGLANAHSHAFHRALRGRTHADGGNFWTWRHVMYAAAGRLDPDSYLALARAVFAEMALAGYTVVGEFHYLHHAPGGHSYDDPNAMGAALIEAAAQAGIRLTLLDTCYLAGGLGGGGHDPLDEIQVRFSDGSVDAWASRVAELRDGELVRIGAAAHSVRGVPADDLRLLAQAVGPDRVVHAHVSEQLAENVAAQAFYGRTPTELLDEAGLLTDRFTAVHATHLSENDIAAYGAIGASACFCPTTERDLADGIGPARGLADARARLSLGSDQHAVIDPFEEIRGLEMHERVMSNERGRFTLPELLDAAAANGYAALGWGEGGSLAEGALADFVTIGLDSTRTVGVRPEQIIYAATGADVLDVVVAGRQIVTDGVHQLGPIAPLLHDALEAIRENP